MLNKKKYWGAHLHVTSRAIKGRRIMCQESICAFKKTFTLFSCTTDEHAVVMMKDGHISHQGIYPSTPNPFVAASFDFASVQSKVLSVKEALYHFCFNTVAAKYHMAINLSGRSKQATRC